MHSLALPSFKAKFSNKNITIFPKLQHNRIYKEISNKVKGKQYIALLIQGDIKKQAQSFPVIKKVSLPKCAGKLVGWFVCFSFNPGEKDSWQSTTEKSVTDCKRHNTWPRVVS